MKNPYCYIIFNLCGRLSELGFVSVKFLRNKKICEPNMSETISH